VIEHYSISFKTVVKYFTCYTCRTYWPQVVIQVGIVHFLDVNPGIGCHGQADHHDDVLVTPARRPDSKSRVSVQDTGPGGPARPRTRLQQPPGPGGTADSEAEQHSRTEPGPPPGQPEGQPGSAGTVLT
jgi:hypothetical protein